MTRALLQQALDALEWEHGGEPLPTLTQAAIEAIRAHLAQPQGEPSGRIVQRVTTCRECPKSKYSGNNLHHCSAAHRKFDDGDMPETIPDWCPLESETQPAPTVQPERKPDSARWNIEWDGEDLLICFDDHDKADKCEYKRYVPASQAQPERKPMSELQAKEWMQKAKVPASDWDGYVQGIWTAEAFHDIGEKT